MSFSVFILSIVFVLNVDSEVLLVNVRNNFVRVCHLKPQLIDVIRMLIGGENKKLIAKADYDDFWIRKVK